MNHPIYKGHALVNNIIVEIIDNILQFKKGD